jgi:hypothetical protein
MGQWVSSDHLEWLCLRFQDTDVVLISKVFNQLTTPFMREIACLADVECVLPRLDFISLMTRSSCPLRTLTLSHLDTTDTSFAECLRVLPSLNKLALMKVTITNETLRMLNFIHSSTTGLSNSLLTDLKMLEYNGRYVDNFPVLASLLESWWDKRTTLDEPSSIARLQSAVLHTTNTVIPDAVSLARLQHLVEEGMRISFVTETDMDRTTWLGGTHVSFSCVCSRKKSLILITL